MQKLAASMPALTASSPASATSTPATPTGPDLAASRAKMMFGCYRKGDAADPDTYTAAVAAVLTLYPPDVVARVTDPRTGLPGRSNFLPTVAEVRAACEEIVQRAARSDARIARERAQLAERRALDAYYAAPRRELPAPTSDARCDVAREAARTRVRADLSRANRRLFEAECRAASLSPDSPVSPGLMRAVNAARVADEDRDVNT